MNSRHQPARQHGCGHRHGGRAIYRWGWQFTGSEGLNEGYVSYFGAFEAAWDDAMVAAGGPSPLKILWPEMHAAFVVSGDRSSRPVAARER
jgi:hypothetical protein